VKYSVTSEYSGFESTELYNNLNDNARQLKRVKKRTLEKFSKDELR
jgi:hypothetical protein